ncbi:hypothetical protein QBK99_05340 [Corticibacterium sp. UT-5YL-CI-8]|nr:hypothetical protein [Tianweitania sp. UT-5YL-CI-8]
MTTDPITVAADWLASTPLRDRPHPLMPHLRLTFGLDTAQAIAAIRAAQLKLARAS